MDEPGVQVTYPRRRLIRGVLRTLAIAAFAVLADFRIEGREHFPERGPLLVVANHFSYIDPVAVIRVVPWPMEFVGGFRRPNAPPIVNFIPSLWGFYPLFRGTGARDALHAAQAILRRDGVIGIFPEGTSAAAVLRSPRPGAAFLAAQTGAQILPLALDGMVDIFPSLRRGRRARATVRVGEPFGPFTAEGRGRERRHHLEEIGHQIMQHIADLLPASRHGRYSDDPALRAAAEEIESYPWDHAPES